MASAEIMLRIWFNDVTRKMEDYQLDFIRSGSVVMSPINVENGVLTIQKGNITTCIPLLEIHRYQIEIRDMSS